MGQTMRLFEECQGKINSFSQIQMLLKLWAFVFNCEIPPLIVAGHFNETLASQSKQLKYLKVGLNATFLG
jgi:hypothetical protein